jgi:hypothetical protein
MPWRRMGCTRIDPHFLDLGTSWRWVVNFTPRPLYPRGKCAWYPLYRRLGGPQRCSGRHGEDKILSPPGLELRLLCPPARSKSLYRLSYRGSSWLSSSGITTFVGRSWHFALFRGYNRDSQFRRKGLAAHENIFLTGLNVIFILRHICFNYSY